MQTVWWKEMKENKRIKNKLDEWLKKSDASSKDSLGMPISKGQESLKTNPPTSRFRVKNSKSQCQISLSFEWNNKQPSTRGLFQKTTIKSITPKQYIYIYIVITSLPSMYAFQLRHTSCLFIIQPPYNTPLFIFLSFSLMHSITHLCNAMSAHTLLYKFSIHS